ncbi:hypothetical protein AAFF_G00261470 [Aldrovandia affinis]|uniref:Uncharacterized protein n=1 Tax=Aldrovandia affinis TaxID=143900 RepID=A0AAD7RCB7_9TELE|nr:hypothetical protein AAFF_G00261470 [Aldrovandia affinis]
MASEASALEELHSELTCPVCLELFREPVILECGHHFCRHCITRCWRAKPDERPTCPQCRKTCTPTLRPNSLLRNVVDSHEEKLKLFCEDDQVAICLVCGMSRDHRTHSVIPINEAFENYREKLSSALQRVALQTEEASCCQTQTNQKMMEIKEQAGELEEQISCEFRQMREFLEREEEETKGRLRRVKEERLRLLDETLTHTALQISALEITAQQLQDKLREEDNPAQLRGIKNFISSIETLFQRPPEVSTDLQPGAFVGPLQYRVWRKMGSALKPGTGPEPAPSLLPRPLTLDPDTAYPRLTVSPCRRSVRVGEIQPNLPDNPERFTRYNIVLGSQGFCSGTHYWEVEVGEKTAWGLGVARESVNRKEEISLCPEDGFWTLVLRNGDEYEACTSTENLLALPRKPLRIGVYLDYRRGRVAFYDAGDMSHLFTFSDTFHERLYPYFNPWPIINARNAEPLTIITPQP